jgi:hypothetical protein
MSGGWGSAAVTSVGAGISAMIMGNAAGKAAEAQKNASLEGIRQQQDWWNRSIKGWEPYQNAGQGAVDQLSALTGPGGEWSKGFSMSDFQQDPGYQFRLAEGQKALDRMQSARGNFLSGAAIKQGLNYNSGMASQEYANAYGRFNNDRNMRYQQLMGLAGLGANAANAIGGYAQGTGSRISDLWTQFGNAQAAGTLGTAMAHKEGNDKAYQAWANYLGGNQYTNGSMMGGGGGGGGGFNWGAMGEFGAGGGMGGY